MKQRITVEQLRELTPEQRQKLREWWKPQDFDVHVFGHHCDVHQISDASKFLGKENSLPLLSIGQCIDLLQNEEVFAIDRKNELTECFWLVSLNQALIDGNELIDALWQAVKEAL